MSCKDAEVREPAVGIGTPPSGMDFNGLIFRLDDLLAKVPTIDGRVNYDPLNEARVLVQEVRDWIKSQSRIL